MANKKTKTSQQISVIVTIEQLEKLRVLSANTLVPQNALVRAAIDHYLELRKAELKGGR
jgi:predicted DNA-binding protein